MKRAVLLIKTYLVQRPSVSVVQNFHAIHQDLLGFLPRQRIFASLNGLAEKRLSAVTGFQREREKGQP